VSAISKLLVVLVSFMAVLLVAITVPFVYNTQNYAAQVSEAHKLRDAALASVNEKERAISELQKQEASQVRELRSEKNQLNSQINNLLSQLASVSAELEDAKSANTAAKADVSRLVATNAQYAEIVEGLQDQRDELLAANLTKDTQLIERADRNNVLESQKGTLERRVRLLQEDLTAAQETAASLEAKLSTVAVADAGAAGEPAPFVSGVPINGVVTDVSSAGGERFLQINVGTNDGVATNMKFMVHRGGEYLGSLIITRVDSNAAAGRVELAQGDINVNDKVLSGGS